MTKKLQRLRGDRTAASRVHPFSSRDLGRTHHDFRAARHFNLALLQANNGTNFTYNWSASNLAVTQTTSPSIMTLTRSQGSGSLLVTLTLNNGTENVTRATSIAVQEPATDPWVERTPLANEKPVAGQFFARNPFTNLGTIYYRGTQSGTPDDVFLKVYRTPPAARKRSTPPIGRHSSAARMISPHRSRPASSPTASPMAPALPAWIRMSPP